MSAICRSTQELVISQITTATTAAISTTTAELAMRSPSRPLWNQAKASTPQTCSTASTVTTAMASEISRRRAG